MKITTNCLVEIEYTMVDEQGELLEESDGDEGPVQYVHGMGSILPGLEAALEGQESGAVLEVRLSAEDAFGEYDPSGLVAVPRSEFPPDAELVPGDWITVTVAEDDDSDDEQENELEMRVVELNPDGIVLDANHPLAGKDVTFHVQVLAVREATEDEIAEAQEDLED